MREPKVKTDTLFDGALRVLQPSAGYRVNVDALLLAAFASAGAVSELAVDLGAGVGSIGLVLHHTRRARTLALVEREPELAALARRNLAELSIAGDVYELDLTAGLPRSLLQRAELVCANPPYFSPGEGRPRANRLERVARSGELEPFVRAAARALRGPRARAAFVYPAPALPELLACAAAHGLVAKRLCFVHARAASPARVALLELRRAKPGGLVVEAPLVEWAAPGERSPALLAIVSGDFSRFSGRSHEPAGRDRNARKPPRSGRHSR